MKKNSNILIYNGSFINVSQTFIYHQIVSLKETFGVVLMAKIFENPHDFKIDSFPKIQLESPENYSDRILSKYIRIKYKTMFHVDIQSYLQFRHVLRKGGITAIHAHFGTNAVDILPFAKKYKIPLAVTFHGFDASQALSDKRYRKKLPKLFEYASAIIIVSNHMKETLDLKRWIEKVHLIPCGVNINEFEVNKTKDDTDIVRILHSGRLTGKKGVPDLIRVFHKLSDTHNNIELHIVGDGEEINICKDLVNKFDIKQSVKFYGSVSREKVRQIMEKSDIFVLNSRVDDNGDMEGTPVTLLEAMSVKIPVISTYHAGIPDVVKDGLNGLLVPEKDNRALENALDVLINDRSKRCQLSEKARETVENEHTVELMQQKIKKVFETI